MHKRSHIRNDISAHNDNSDEKPHLTDEQLLLALDGELSSRETARVKGHLKACWSCRARSQAIEDTIAEIVEYRDCLVKSHLPPSIERLETFVSRLEQLADDVGRPSWRSRIEGQLRFLRAFLQGMIPRHVWVSIVVITSFALFFLLFTHLWQLPKVSASQLLENSQVFEVRKLRSVSDPVVYQKLQIRIGTKAVTRTIYRRSVGTREVDHIDVIGPSGEPTNTSSPGQTLYQSDDRIQAAESEVRRTLLAVQWSWQDPLSTTNYSSWRDSLHEKQDEITADNESLTLKTTTSEGSIAEARITFRPIDFHPVAEELRLQDASEVKITEMAWEILPMEAVNPAIFSAATTEDSGAKHPMNLPPRPQRLTDAQLAEVELQARVAMHVAGADLGEQIELDRNNSTADQRSIIVRGIVSTMSRKNDLLAILRAIPNVDVRLQTLEEATARQDKVSADTSGNTAPQVAGDVAAREDRIVDESIEQIRHATPAVAVASSPALQHQLEERYPNAEDRAAFVNVAVEVAQDALVQAWALRRLRDRYTPDTVAQLSHGSQQTLELLIRDHVSMLRQHVEAVRNMISPIVPPVPSDPTAKETSLAGVMLSATPLANDWPTAVTNIFSETQSICDDVVTLLAGSGSEPSETQALVQDLQLALTKLQTQLPMFYNEVSGRFLSEPKPAK
jgi:hypothetical protein